MAQSRCQKCEEPLVSTGLFEYNLDLFGLGWWIADQPFQRWGRQAKSGKASCVAEADVHRHAFREFVR
jgi:hypothetical protein